MLEAISGHLCNRITPEAVSLTIHSARSTAEVPISKFKRSFGFRIQFLVLLSVSEQK